MLNWPDSFAVRWRSPTGKYMGARFAESAVEEATLELFAGPFYSILHGAGIAPGERNTGME